MEETEEKQQAPKKAHKIDYTQATGRRKSAIARVRLFNGPGELLINDKPLGEYTNLATFNAKVQKVLDISKARNFYHATVKVDGSGKASQIDAIILGLARAIQKANKDFRPVLKKAGFLTRDPRVKERRKYGNAQKARKGKQSPKR